jgi:cell wall-associated NlpC family hydrolase
VAADSSIKEKADAALAANGTASFAARRDALAVQVAAELGTAPGPMKAAWRAADAEHQVAVVAALSQLGTPYRRNSSEPGVGFDCSGLTSYAWRQAGYSLPRQSGAQIEAAERRTRATAQAGDLVQYPGHVMMWLGVGDFIVHSPNSGNDVEVREMPSRRSTSVRFGDPTE